MKIKDKINKFDRISGIFSQFSEENKDKLLETAKNLLKVQTDGLTSITALKNTNSVHISPKKT
jgi:hypothetical protein